VRALVTGAAGFIGSTLSDRLVAEGWQVRGVDSLIPYYDPEQKRANIAGLASTTAFEFVEADLISVDLEHLLDGVDAVFHLAGQPGVRLSWADGFRAYSEANIDVTQRLLEAARSHQLQRFVYASSSSVYGDVDVVPTD
jgi:UDP-glucuronate 4-epimerase